MATNLGPGVSRVIDPTAREFREIILQQGKPPMDAEFNLLQEMVLDVSRKGVLSGVPSGWLGNETNLMADYVTRPNWSNWFKFGTQRPGEKQSVMWAVVNGWLVPVTGTRTGTPPGGADNTDTTNEIHLPPPPSNSGDHRVDFVFLEVWLARIPPNPATLNKPRSDSLYRYGNVEGGYSYLPDDLVDPSLGFETSQRVQLQYRIRVSSTNFAGSLNPDGFGGVFAKGANDPNPEVLTAFTFQNMRQELGDAGLWRAGDGSATNALKTVDGYSYAIPLCAVFRRNGVSWLGFPSPNLNGGFNRNPTAVDRTGVRTFLENPPQLAADLTATATTLTLSTGVNLPLPNSPLTAIRIGGEILTYNSVTGPTVGGLVRGAFGTVAEAHKANDPVEILAGRPDGLFADQIALTDILDLRHVVNPNGFDYDTLLQYNLDKLLRGDLRANWKNVPGSNNQGVFLAYQDAVADGVSSTGVTNLDKPDNVRMVWSDAIHVQPLEVIAFPKAGTAPIDYSLNWDLNFNFYRIEPALLSTPDWVDGTVLRMPVTALRNGISDTDQVRWCNEGAFTAQLRLEGDSAPLHPDYYTITSTNADPSIFTSADDLLITLGTPTNPFPTVTDRKLYVRLHALYGAGRGLARLPDAIHSLTIQPTVATLHTAANYPANHYPLATAFAPSWSKYADLPPFGQRGPLPVTAESYVDAGSKTIILQPFREITLPDTTLIQDGTAANVSTVQIRTGVDATATGTTFTDVAADFTAAPAVTVGMALIVTSGMQAGNRFTITGVTSGTDLELDRPLVFGSADALTYVIHTAQGLMPGRKRDGVTPKWTLPATPDPLGLFSSSTDGNALTNNVYVGLPSHLVPKAGAVHVPILPVDQTQFYEGVNFMVETDKGTATTFADAYRNYVPYYNGGSVSYAIFSTQNLTAPFATAIYNSATPYGALPICGMRIFTDARGMGRQGLELPPFYGIARLFGVYEATDYRTNGSPYNPSTRNPLGDPTKAKNLLRQSVRGPTFWIETDEDGDSTFILNAECLDLSRSPTPIGSFAGGNYVVEASIFGFDRDTFSEAPAHLAALGVGREPRLVLTRYVSGNPAMRTQGTVGLIRSDNLNTVITSPICLLPGPLGLNEKVACNYSRTPYGGDAWGMERANADVPYRVGPVASGIAYQLASTKLNFNSLSKPNPKAFEVLASLSFITTAGTGRISGPVNGANPLHNPGYEDLSNYPPAAGTDPRPNFFLGGVTSSPEEFYQSRYNGLTTRLPLGALRRDKDFRGNFFTNLRSTQFFPTSLVGAWGGMAPRSNLEVTSLLNMADTSSSPGTIIVHVDGSPEDASALTNFRTHRGGSGFIGNGSNPGGWVSSGFIGEARALNPHTNLLAGVAYLVRNTVTSTNLSAGDELMMLIATQYHAADTNPSAPTVTLSTVGVGEGDAAMDYYRIEGHPLIRDNVGAEVDPSTIQLAEP